MKPRPRLLRPALASLYRDLVTELGPRVVSALRKSQNSEGLVADATRVLRQIAAKPRGFEKVLRESRLPDPTRLRRAGTGWRDPVAEAWGTKPRTQPDVPSASRAIPPELVAKVMTSLDSRDAAKRLKSFGLTLAEGTYFLLKVLDVSKPNGAAAIARSIHSRAGLFFELAMPFHPEVLAREAQAARNNAARFVAAEWRKLGAQNGNDAKILAREVDEAIKKAFETGAADAAGATAGVGPVAGGVASWGSVRLARNFWLMRLTGLRDEAGKMVADHFRGLVFFDTARKVVEIIPVGIGESKFASGTYAIVEQLKKTFSRLRSTLSSADLPIPDGVEVRVRTPAHVVAVLQTERAPPVSQLRGFERSVKKAMQATSLEVDLVKLDAARQANDARELVRQTIGVLLHGGAPAK
jgi:hypothetical protein